jgi:prenylcysteine oxidase/farnesylcysteine lyase
MRKEEQAMEWKTVAWVISLLMVQFIGHTNGDSQRVCIVGSGIGGSSAAHFLRKYSQENKETETETEMEIHVFEKNPTVGGRMAMVELAGDKFEAGGSILHPKNLHTLQYTELLGLKRKTSSDDDSDFGIWDGQKFIFKTFPGGKSGFPATISTFINNLLIFWRYGTSLLKMQEYVSNLLDRFLRYYEDSRPIFYTVDEMLKWADLHEYTRHTLQKELVAAGLSPRLISELVTVIMRINYGQNVDISGLAGAVSLCGSGGDLWSVEGGNWQMAAGLIDQANVSLHLNKEVASISLKGEQYEVNSTDGQVYDCEVVVVATPLDEVKISFIPLISIPERHLHHTYTTFVRGLLNPVYFGLSSTSSLPDLIGTLEVPDLPFSSISILKDYSRDDKAYKIFSRKPMADDLLNEIFSDRKETIRIDWAAYPHYQAPEKFAPFLLDGHHLYYINAFENAASTMETSSVSAENIARLILSRLPGGRLQISRSEISDLGNAKMHPEL